MRNFFFERGALTQTGVDELLADGGVPVYRDPSHSPEYATIVKPEMPGLTAVWAHPSMPMFEIAALWRLRSR